MEAAAAAAAAELEAVACGEKEVYESKGELRRTEKALTEEESWEKPAGMVVGVGEETGTGMGLESEMEAGDLPTGPTESREPPSSRILRLRRSFSARISMYSSRLAVARVG